LLEIVTGEGLGENLELVGGKDGLREFYFLKSDKEIEEKIGKMLMRKFREEKHRHLKRMLGELLVVDGEERLKIGGVVDHAFLTRDKGTTTNAIMSRLERELDSRNETKRQFEDMKKRSEEMKSAIETIVDQNEEIIDEEGVTQDFLENVQNQQNQSHQQTQQDYNSISNQVVEMMDKLEGMREWMEEDQRERFHDITKMMIRASNVKEMKDCLELVEGLYEEIPHLIDEERVLELREEIEKLISDLSPHLMSLDPSIMIRVGEMRKESGERREIYQLERMVEELEGYGKNVRNQEEEMMSTILESEEQNHEIGIETVMKIIEIRNEISMKNQEIRRLEDLVNSIRK